MVARPRVRVYADGNPGRTAMKVASVATEFVNLPAEDPLGNSPQDPNGKRPIVTVTVRTDDGIEGLGVTYFGGALTKTLRLACDQLGEVMIGEDPMRVEAIHQKLRDAAGHHAGPGAGIYTLAVSALDTALW